MCGTGTFEGYVLISEGSLATFSTVALAITMPADDGLIVEHVVLNDWQVGGAVLLPGIPGVVHIGSVPFMEDTGT